VAEEWAQGGVDNREIVQRCEYEEQEPEEAEEATDEPPRRATIKVRRRRHRAAPADDDEWSEQELQDEESEKEQLRQEVADLHALLDRRVGEDALQALSEKRVETVELRVSELAVVMDVLRSAEQAAQQARQICTNSAKGFEDKRSYFYRGQCFINDIMMGQLKKAGGKKAAGKKASGSRDQEDDASPPKRRDQVVLSKRKRLQDDDARGQDKRSKRG